MKFIWMDFKRGFTEPTFLGAMGLNLIILIASLGYYLMTRENYQATEAFINCQSLILPFIAPLVATLPYSNMSMIEEDSGYKKLLCMKGTRKTYDIERFLTNGIFGASAIVIPLLLFILVCGIFSPYTNFEAIIDVIILDFMFGFSYASVAYGLTFVNTKRYIPTVTPQVVYLLFIYAFPYLGLEEFYPPLSFSPWILPDKVVPSNILFQFVLMLGIAVGLILIAKTYKWGIEQVERRGK